ncbi:MAG TPA: hypothetical protein VMV10_28780, partial [Pirellulales bacterium]|nr:hypothetical protein [Pirellulales bacterium]
MNPVFTVYPASRIATVGVPIWLDQSRVIVSPCGGCFMADVSRCLGNGQETERGDESATVNQS